MGFENYNFIHKISNTSCALHQTMYSKSRNKLQSRNIHKSYIISSTILT